MLLFVGIFVITSVIANSDAIPIKINAGPDPKSDAEATTKDPGSIAFPAENAAAEQAPDPLTVKVDCQAIQSLFSTFFHLMGDSMKDAKPASESVVVAHDDTNMYVNSTENTSDKSVGGNLELTEIPNSAEIRSETANEKHPTDVKEEDKEAEKEEDEEQEREEEKRIGGKDKNGESEDKDKI